MVKKIILGAIGLVFVAVIGFVIYIGPRNIIGMIKYDQRREGTLQVGDQAPDVPVVALSGEQNMLWRAVGSEKPTVLIFGSFT